MANANDVVNLISILQARAHALRTATDATYDNARERLRQAFVTARQYRNEGQGTIDASTWASFETTLTNSLYTFNAEEADRQAGSLPASGEVMVFTEEEVYGAPTTRVATAAPAAAPATTRTYVPRATAAPSTAAPAAAAPTATMTKGGAATTGAPTTATPWETYSQPTQQGFFAWLNPQDQPVYLRPWFIGLGASSILALTYALWKATEASRRPAPVPAPAPAPRSAPKTVAQ